PAQTALRRLPLHHPEAPPRATPVVGKAQQVKGPCPSFPGAPRTGLAVWWALERHQPRLIWMKRETKFAKPLGQHRQHPPGVLFTGKAHDEVVRVANEESATFEAWLDL